jgi:hypothetical protein
MNLGSQVIIAILGKIQTRCLNRGVHWYVAVINPEDRDIQILNSIPSMGPGEELQNTVTFFAISYGY